MISTLRKKEWRYRFLPNLTTVVLNDKVIELRKFKTEDIVAGINRPFPGSGYISHYDNKLFFLSASGIISYKDLENFNKLKIKKEQARIGGYTVSDFNIIRFKQISSNINEYVTKRNFEKEYWFTAKDIQIFKNKIFVSYANQVKNNCWNTSIVYSELNLKKLNFKKLFIPNEMVCADKNQDNEFNAHQSGGRIIEYDENHLIFTTGDYRNRYLAQKDDSSFGKVLKVNFKNGEYRIISKGHRNPQGLFYDRKNNFLLETEHQGGDEINLIKLNYAKDNQIPNFGWPISSYGEHYGKFEDNRKKYKVSFKKSHEKEGFIEPIKYFVPSIGISEISGLNKDRHYVASSMRARALFFFQLTEENKIKDIKKINLSERVRDLFLHDNKLFMFLESSTSIGILDLSAV